MDVLVGLLIVALGSLGQSSSYVPINKIQSWSWESFGLSKVFLPGWFFHC